MMIKQILWVVLSAVCCFGAERRTWDVDGVSREALVHFPESSENPPLVFVFHGHGGNMDRISGTFRIHELWPEAVVVYMQGLPTPTRLTDPEGKRSGWNSDSTDSASRDLKFFDAVYNSLKGQVDTNRVYITGHSNGGGFTYCLWAARGDLFAAMAPSSAAFRKGLALMKPKPALHVMGETDPVVKVAWQERMIQFVKSLNGCGEGEPWHSSGDLTGTIYPSKTGTPLITLIHPGGHKFPTEALELIIRFFKEQ
jgi:polyhydroxybutyrate depolymerase